MLGILLRLCFACTSFMLGILLRLCFACTSLMLHMYFVYASRMLRIYAGKAG
jgi:hypothetical protein